jgi:hypothetical protein
MTITKSEFKQAIIQERTQDFSKFLSTRSRTSRNDDLKLPLSRLAKDGHSRQVWVVTVSSRTQYADLFTSSFWMHVANRFQLGDEITVRDDGLTFWAKLLVTQADAVRDFVMMQELYKKDLVLMKIEQPEIDGYTTRYEGLHEGWQVIRSVDQHVMKANFPTQHDATAYIRADLKTTKIT